MFGFLYINKPSGPTSHDIVDSARRLTGERRVGHAGTLDPFASGLLIVGVGREATKHLGELIGLDKEYIATIKLGATSDTYDRTGKITGTGHQEPVTRERIQNVLQKFTGTIQQIPPMYSAKKINGKKLYELARAGKEITRQPNAVTIHNLELLEYDIKNHLLKIIGTVSSGTYIRSLAHDIGQALGCGAYVAELERTAIGPFKLTEAQTLNEPLQYQKWETIKTKLLN